MRLISRRRGESAVNHLSSDLPGHTACGRELHGHYRTFDIGRITCDLCRKAEDNGGFDAKVYAEIHAAKVAAVGTQWPSAGNPAARDWIVFPEHFQGVSYTHGPVSGARCGGGTKRTRVVKKGSR